MSVPVDKMYKRTMFYVKDTPKFGSVLSDLIEAVNDGSITPTDKKFIVGRSNLACTVFVPWDCRMNCPFCNTKQEYATLQDISFNNVMNGINFVANSQPYKRKDIKEWVITGGEPLDYLGSLGKLLINMPHDRPIYINTMMPTPIDDTNKRKLLSILKYVHGISVSRHFGNGFDDKGIEWLNDRGFSVRVNCVIESSDCSSVENLKKKISEHVSRYEDICDSLNLRADYTGIKNAEDLRGLGDIVVAALCELYPYKGDWGCDVCNDNLFHTEHNFPIHYHRGYESTLIRLPNEQYIINDVIVKPNGNILLDWNMDINEDFTLVAEWLSRRENRDELPAAEAKESHRTMSTRVEGRKPYCGGSWGHYTCGGGSDSDWSVDDTSYRLHPRRSIDSVRGSCGGGSCGGGGY